LSVSGSIGDMSFFGKSSSIFVMSGVGVVVASIAAVVVVVVVVVVIVAVVVIVPVVDLVVVVVAVAVAVTVAVVALFDSATWQTPFCTTLLRAVVPAAAAFVAELSLGPSLELAVALGPVTLEPGLAIGAGFLAGEGRLAGCFGARESRLLGAAAVESRGLAAAARAEEICLLAVSLTCLSIIGDLAPAGLGLGVEAGAVLGLAVPLLVAPGREVAVGLVAGVPELGRALADALTRADLGAVAVAVVVAALLALELLAGGLRLVRVVVEALLGPLAVPFALGFLSAEVEPSFEATEELGGFGFGAALEVTPVRAVAGFAAPTALVALGPLLLLLLLADLMELADLAGVVDVDLLVRPVPLVAGLVRLMAGVGAFFAAVVPVVVVVVALAVALVFVGDIGVAVLPWKLLTRPRLRSSAPLLPPLLLLLPPRLLLPRSLLPPPFRWVSMRGVRRYPGLA
jgi:hypothetical protein